MGTRFKLTPEARETATEALRSIERMEFSCTAEFAEFLRSRWGDLFQCSIGAGRYVRVMVGEALVGETSETAATPKESGDLHHENPGVAVWRRTNSPEYFEVILTVAPGKPVQFVGGTSLRYESEALARRALGQFQDSAKGVSGFVVHHKTEVLP